MTNKIEKTYLILLVVLLIICIIITIFVCQKSNEDYKPDKEIKIHISHSERNTAGMNIYEQAVELIHTLEDLKSLQDKIDKVSKTIYDNMSCSLDYVGTSTDMKISYAITVCNEYEEIQKLISTLRGCIREEDEIVVLFDKKAGTAEVWNYLADLQKEDWIKAYPGTFKGHFGDWKNYLTGLCTGDFIFQIDADEYPNRHLLYTLPVILEQNKNADVILVPRVNTVKGLTQEHITKWGWNVNEKGWVNWPDYQWRLYRNIPSIKWVNKVHERLDGFEQYARLPTEEEYALYHPKGIDRQEKQNNYYDTL